MKYEDFIKASQTATTGGRKFDGDKLEYGLLPPLALKATVHSFPTRRSSDDRKSVV